jgi:hypothetical protein
MRYANVALPATGGGVVFAGLLGMGANVLVASVLAIMLIIVIVGFIKLKKGEKNLNYPRR